MPSVYRSRFSGNSGHRADTPIGLGCPTGDIGSYVNWLRHRTRDEVASRSHRERSDGLEY